MTSSLVPYYACREDILEPFCAYCTENGYANFFLIADQNTYPILGLKIEQALLAQGADVQKVILNGSPVIANETSVMNVLVEYKGDHRIFLGVGSGTITDIARFTSHRTGNPYISLPTAPSVDGYTSGHAALILNHFKVTLSAQSPLAIFAELPILCAAPRKMIAAGFGDLLAKFSSLSDWKMGALLWGEPFDATVAAQAARALEIGLSQIEVIAANRPEGIQALMEALIISGASIIQAGASRPASGSEHHIAHVWEMMRLQKGVAPCLHGETVAVAAGLVARLYGQLRAMSQSDVKEALARFQPPDRKAWTDELRAVHGPAVGQILDAQRAFMDLDAEEWRRISQKIIKYWPFIQEISAGVPQEEQLKLWLKRMGTSVEPYEIGLTAEDTSFALRYAHTLRNRFTILKLLWILSPNYWNLSGTFPGTTGVIGLR